MSQVRKEIKGLEIVMPKTEIPDWWDYSDQGGNPTFRARGEVPNVALALFFDKINYLAVGLHLFVNGEQIEVRRQQFLNFPLAEGHVLLFDLRGLFSDEEWESLDARVGHDNWKEVKCETDITPAHWAGYVYKGGPSRVEVGGGFLSMDIPFMPIPYSPPSYMGAEIIWPAGRKAGNLSSQNRVIHTSAGSLQTVVKNLKRLQDKRKVRAQS